jgi:hypothetical protein
MMSPVSEMARKIKQKEMKDNRVAHIQLGKLKIEQEKADLQKTGSQKIATNDDRIMHEDETIVPISLNETYATPSAVRRTNYTEAEICTCKPLECGIQ